MYSSRIPVSTDHDQSWLQTPAGSVSLGQNEQIVIGGENPGPLRHEPQMVQEAGIVFF